VEPESDIILVSTVGVIAFKENADAEILVEAGQCLVHTVSAGTTVVITLFVSAYSTSAPLYSKYS
jgi:hypothetical protein